MKPSSLFPVVLSLAIGIGISGDLTAQIMHIPHVPDLQQPTVPWWGNNELHTCAPAAVANICVHWDDSIHHSNAVGLNSGVISEYVPSYLHWFMGTNGEGDQTRANPFVYGQQDGTITMDIDTGFQEYVRWDSSHLFTWPFTLPAKFGYDWTIERDETKGFHHHMTEIEMRRPDIVVFKYWNPDPTGVVIPSEMGGDSIHFFLWGPPVPSTGEPNPVEEFYFDEKPNSVGHAVTGVGYLFGWDPDEGGPLDPGDWIICHDNWPTTPVNVAIPWDDALWIATITADPGLDTVHPYISCMDTTVYLDGTGQFHLDESYIVDSVWDNNGVEQLFLNEYYVACWQTGTPAQITAGAMDMFGNLSQCTAAVTILDTIRPVPLCRDTTVYLDASGNVSIDSSYIDGGSTDNCGISTIELSRSSFDCQDTGPNIIDVTVTDANGNHNLCQATVTVLDTIPPIPLCMDTTVYLDASGNVSIDSTYVDGGSSDNCGISAILLSKHQFTCSDIGDNPVTLTVNDESGNSGECTVQVKVLDTIPPVISCTDTTVYLDSSGNFTIDSTFILAGFSDNCNVSQVVLSRTNFTAADLDAAQPVSVSVYDGSGNTSTGEVMVTVMDTIPSSVSEMIFSDRSFEFIIKPNPSNGVFNIESKLPVEDCMLEIYSISGLLLKKQNLPEGKGKLDLSNHPEGVYILKITGKKGREYLDRLIRRY
jgi:hypothetical protein